MRLLKWGMWGVLMGGLLTVGAACNSGATPSVTDEAQAASGDESVAPSDGKADAKKAAKAPARKTLEGRWVLLISQQPPGQQGYFDFPTVLFDFQKDAEKSDKEAGGYSVKVLDETPFFPDPKLKSWQIDGESVTLVFDLGNAEIDFQGRLSDGVVRGNMDFGGLTPDPARLEATEEKTAENFKEPRVPDGVEQLQKAAESDDKFKEFRAFAVRNPTNPLAVFILEQLTGFLAEEQLDAGGVEKFIKDAQSVAGVWGPRMERAVKLNVAVRLAAAGHLPDLALKYLDEIEGDLSPERKEQLASTFSAVRQRARTSKAQSLLASGEEQAGLELARELRGKHPLDPTITWILASHYEKKGEIDEAIPLYATLAALPLMEMAVVQDPAFQRNASELPSQTLATLWTKKHGDTEELGEYLDQVYADGLAQLTEQSKAELPAAPVTGNRVAVAELFTGAQCPPCVAADVASGVLEQTYEPSQVLVLRYHEPVPDFDPLANFDTLKRFEHYGLQGTPSVVVNGQPIAGVGGFLDQVGGAYRATREAVDPSLTDETAIQLALSAEAGDGSLTVRADASGLAQDPKDLRLVVALAEEQVHMVAPNGIRQHDMVVRSLFGHPTGVEPKDGRLAFEATVKLDDLKQQLIQEIAALKRQARNQLPERPLDMTELRLVAFVQHAETKEILQAASAPVSGEVTYSVETAPPVPANSSPAETPEADKQADRPLFILPETPASSSESPEKPE